MPNILQELYDSGINWRISTFQGVGFIWKLGDHIDGWEFDGISDTLEEAIDALAAVAVHRHPDSAFARSRRVQQ